MQGGEEAEQYPRQQRNTKCERCDTPVEHRNGDRRATRIGQPRDVPRHEQQQSADTPGTQRKTEQSAAPRQQDALGEQLSDDTPTVGADGGADRQFALPSCRPGEQKVGDVRAGDQQHECDRSKQNQQGRPHVAGCRVPHGNNGDALSLIHPFRVRLAKLLAENLHLRLRRRDRDTGFQPSRHVQVVALVGTVRVRLQGKPDVRFRFRMEAVWQDADDRVRHAVQENGAPQDLATGAEAGLPQAVADHGHGRTVRKVFFLRERRPANGDAEDLSSPETGRRSPAAEVARPSS